MTLEQKIGSMLMFGWMGCDDGDATTANSHVRELVKDMQVGGIVLLARNIADDLAVTADMLNELQSISREPLLVNVDQEGGMVNRLTKGVTVFPSNMALGATGDPALAYKAAAAIAEELCAIGINYNYAPSVDVNNNADNPIIGTRSYGESADLVAEFGVQAIKGYQDYGMIACAKHFPGHGDTAVDSHLALPSVPYSRERLDSIELKPFKAAVEAGVASIMTTHIMFPALDKDFPATLSPIIINEILRGEYGYDGVITTDCLQMKAISDNWGSAEGSVMAVEAGVDILLIGHDLSVEREVREALIKAVKDGRISEDRIDQSVRRIREMKNKYGLSSRKFNDPEKLPGILRNKNHLALQKEIAEHAVTLVRNEGDVVPLAQGEKVLVTGIHETIDPLAEALKQNLGSVESFVLEDEQLEAVHNKAAGADVVVIATCPREPWKPASNQELQKKLVESFINSGKKLIVVAVREPYDIRHFPKAGCYVCLYGYRGGTIEAVADLIAGKIRPKGSLPVTIPV